MSTKKRSTTANGKKPSTRKTAPRKPSTQKSPPRARTRKAADAQAPIVLDEEPAAPAALSYETLVTTVVPEQGFVARMAPPPPPRPRPEQRRGIFLDVENTSRAQDIEQVLRYLVIDRVGIDTDFTAVGNWRVIGHETARLLAQSGAGLVHSAPSAGVRDWSDLRIAVAAGVWLAGARPGDMIDIVSDDQAFDAVGDAAASLGVQYRRLSYRSLRGQIVEEVSEPAPADDGRARRRGRGGRGRRGGVARRHDEERPRPEERPRHQAPAARHHAPAARHHAPARVAEPVESEANAHTAPHDEVIDVVRDLMITSPSGVTLDQLANALRERGFRRTSGSPRLITRLKRIKELDVNRSGLIRVVDEADLAQTQAARPAAASRSAEVLDIELLDNEETDTEDDGEPEGESTGEGEADAAVEGSGEGEPRRRRRRRGGRRRRGRRGGGGGTGTGGEPESGGEVIAAAPPSTPEY